MLDNGFQESIIPVLSNTVVRAPFVSFLGQQQKNGLSSEQNKACQRHLFCISFALCAPLVTSAHNIAGNHVRGRLPIFWHTWLSLGSNLKVVSTLKEGYNLPVKIRPPSDKVMVKIRWICQSPQEQLLEGHFAFPDRKAGSGKGLSNFPGPFPFVSHLYLSIERFSLQQEESVTSLDLISLVFSHPQKSKVKKRRFHLNGQAY